MKKLFTLFLALVATTALWAEDFSVNGIYYKILTDKTKKVEVTYRDSSYDSYDSSYSGSVTIPSSVTYNGTTYSVTSIGRSAFYGCSGLTSITIPNSVTCIGNDAFLNCSSLTSPVYNAHCFAYMPTSYSGAYTIPEGIKQIAGAAFRNCSSLTSITIPNSVTCIGSKAFFGCSALTSVVIPNSVTKMEWGAFYGCSGLTSVAISNRLTILDYSVFSCCSSLMEVIIPEGVNEIKGWGEDFHGAFMGCTSLRYVSIPRSMKSIGELAFDGCSGLTSVTIPKGVKSIGDRAFPEHTKIIRK